MEAKNVALGLIVTAITALVVVILYDVAKGLVKGDS